MTELTKNKKKYKHWFYGFVLINIIFLIIAVISNPYRLTPINITIRGINDIKPRLYEYQRYIKLFDIAYQKPKTVILGSSRVLWGIDPQNPILQTYPPVYNAGVMGPPLYETLEYFRHALANQPDLKRVVLALDFYSFNAEFDNRDLILKDIFGKGPRQILKIRRELLFDYGAMIETLWYSMTRKQVKSLREDGRLTPDPLEARSVYDDFFNPPQPPVANKTVVVKNSEIKSSATKNVEVKIKPDKKIVNTVAKAAPQTQMRNVLYESFKISKQSMDALREIVETCKKRNIELYIYITPTLNNAEETYYREHGLWSEFASFQRQLANLHPFWDFTSWNKITMDKNSFIDGSHHIFPVGNLIMERIFNKKDPAIPETFGRYISTNNVNKHLQNLTDEYLVNKAKI